MGPRNDIGSHREHMGDRTPVNEAEKPPSGGRTYRGRAGECPRIFAGFVSLRGDICPPNPLRGRRLVNGKVKQVEKANERHVHSQDSWAHEATSARAVGSTWRKTLYVVGSNAFRRKKTIPLGNRSGKAGTREWGDAPPAEGELTEEKPENAHAHSRDSWAHEATLAREPSARAEAIEREG